MDKFDIKHDDSLTIVKIRFGVSPGRVREAIEEPLNSQEWATSRFVTKCHELWPPGNEINMYRENIASVRFYNTVESVKDFTAGALARTP